MTCSGLLLREVACTSLQHERLYKTACSQATTVSRIFFAILHEDLFEALHRRRDRSFGASTCGDSPLCEEAPIVDQCILSLNVSVCVCVKAASEPGYI